MDQETLEKILNKNMDDLAVSLSRSFERMEEHLDAIENRLCSRLADIEAALGEINLNQEALAQSHPRNPFHIET